MKWNNLSISILIAVISLLLFVPFLGGSHLFDWDEVNFAEAAREMLLTGEYSYVQINFQPFWEKPPLFIWMQVLSMKTFGINEFAARFPNAICGALSLVLLFNIGQRLLSVRFGLLWVLVYAGSFLSQFYFRSGIIDPWFNLFIFIGIHQLISASKTEYLSQKHIFISGIFVGLAVLTKGPTALALVGICAIIYFVFQFKQHKWKVSDALIFLSTVILIGFSWFFIEIVRGRGEIVQEFIEYHIRLFSESEAGHGQPFYYHPIVLLIGCFPMSLFLLFSWTKKDNPNTEVAHYKKWMSILFWVVLIVFSIVKTKIVHYSSLTYFPMSFLAAWYVHQLIEEKRILKRTHQVILLFFIGLFSTAFILFGVLDSIKEPLLNLLKNDPFTLGNFSQNVPDGSLDWLIGVFFLLGGIVSVPLLYNGKIQKGIMGLFGTSLLTISLVSIFIGPKIDKYVQSSLFNFYEEHAETHYLKPVAFHSYAHLFYGKRNPIAAQPEHELDWMIYQTTDKPVYFIVRVQNLETTFGYFPYLKEVKRIGGFVILEK